MIRLRHSEVIPPQSRLILDGSHRLHEGLQFLAYPRLSSFDVVNGVEGVVSSGVTDTATMNGEVCNQAANNDYAYYDNSLSSVFTDEITILCVANLSSRAQWGSIVNQPHYTSSWSTPFHSFGLISNSSTTAARFHIAISGSTSATTDSATGFYDHTGKHAYAVRRSSSDVDFFKDGEVFTSTSSFTASNIVANGEPIHVGNRNRNNLGEGSSGDFYLAAVWNRALTDDEMVLVSSDMLSPIRKLRLIPYAPAAPTGTWLTRNFWWNNV